ncbi:MAG: hypothetical protein GXP31_05300 [Kiritimatiellaeota bacterium]|nr:hypothetical protein [Kiritimatiellota bacterium]
MPELEQLKRDRTIPAKNLRVAFTPPRGRRIERVVLNVPGRRDKELPLRDGAFTVPEPTQYAAVQVQSAPQAD